ncbi:asparagine synthase (glutamine-hydrolyzing) [Curvibacter sp. RS43]|uniref:asparagine synthase (glutamine-hydrolyzing) n=1 Tax=Curvibacter microcysteis TaxID=3026419 RepID=UPI002360D37B|nr:asparagine synthase (glutamine-hydrolyzing) [Curvibacter sp. RS43]MDD0808783.1 asparagine synthase (glutamine-hydrolyzing) [Curvibacter sp. RS43]
MCGIAGGFWPRGLNRVEGRLQLALEAMRLRGPDDQGSMAEVLAQGTLALGQARLSIIDLSPGGHQPMDSQDRHAVLVFNGEIYNYRELRTELSALGRTFSSDSDTEVLLAAWQQWGSACLPRLVGMFAFAVFDRERSTLTCVRDAFGIKPLYFTQEEGSFLFASDIPAIRALKSSKFQLDWQRAYDYLVHGNYDSSTRTFLEGVDQMPPGHLVTLDLKSGQLGPLQSWWQPTLTERADLSFSAATELVRETFLDNIRLHLRSDVPLGAALSGGVDSSAVVCAMRHIEPDLPIHTFSYIARGSAVSEEAWVDQINLHVGATPHKVVVSAQELARDLDDMIRAQGEPFGSTSIYAQYRVFQLAKQHGVTVTLDGQGADELLAGYSGYPGPRLRSLIETGQLSEAWDFLNQWSQWPGRSRQLGAQQLLAEYAQGPVYDLLRRLSGRADTPAWLDAGALDERGIVRRYPRQRAADQAAGRRLVSELGLSLTRRGLPALLRHGDRNSMRFSVESRVPFLTTGMADLLLSLPESYLISPQGETKHVFRAAMRGIVPDAVLDRRDKIGFSTPEQEWLSSMAPTALAWLRDSSDIPFIKKDEMLKAFERMTSGGAAFSWQAWRWINFARWHDHFLT